MGIEYGVNGILNAFKRSRICAECERVLRQIHSIYEIEVYAYLCMCVVSACLGRLVCALVFAFCGCVHACVLGTMRRSGGVHI